MQNTNHSPAQSARWRAFDSQESLYQTAAQTILRAADQAISARGSFSIVLAGGNTPKSVYELLRSANTDWSKWHIYYNDDRCLPVDHPDRNSLMAEETWLKYVSIPSPQIHAIPAELGPVNGAKSYAQTLAGLDDFDLVLLGLGEDGHTASLFPGLPWDDSVDAFPIFDAPKPPPERVSISRARLSRTRAILFLVTGAGKQNAVNEWRQGQAIPASQVNCPNGVDIYCHGVDLV